MNWLGPSLIMGSCPLGFGYGLHALRRAPERVAAQVAFAWLLVEFLLWAFLIAVNIAAIMESIS